MTRAGQASGVHARHPGSMWNVVRFEVCDHATGVRLMQRLAPRWAAMFCGSGDEYCVKGRLRPEADGVAGLLRAAGGFVREGGLVELRFELDDRRYAIGVRGGDQGGCPAGAA